MGSHHRAVIWRVSGNDFVEHGFYVVNTGRDMSEALCTHSVPSDRLVDGVPAPKCISCLLVHGDDLANNGGDPGAAGYQRRDP